MQAYTTGDGFYVKFRDIADIMDYEVTINNGIRLDSKTEQEY